MTGAGVAVVMLFAILFGVGSNPPLDPTIGLAADKQEVRAKEVPLRLKEPCSCDYETHSDNDEDKS